MSEHDDEGTLSALPKGFVAPPWAPPESSNSTTTSADQPKVPVSGAVHLVKAIAWSKRNILS